MNSERLIGLSYACERFHSGQWSRGYRLMSRIQWRPRGQAEYLQPREEWSEARDWAAHYIRYARNHPKAL
jgi:hypothetical protein